VVLYSDGLTEAMNPQGQQFGRPRVVALLQDWADRPLRQTVDALMREVESWCGPTLAQDDISVMAVELRGLQR
jgi:sigma-B regulation protein RsbU (phosphoserine phosphatase)